MPTSNFRGAVAATVASLVGLTACGLQVSSPDLFVLTRTGPGAPLRLLVNDGGTIRCDGGKPKTLPDPLLLDARQLADDLDKDAKAGLRFSSTPRRVYSFTVKLQDGTITFPDTAASGHAELARAELFVLQAAHGPCGLPG
jgi:hypothetical protein